MTWQPIETAPKDGTLILLANIEDIHDPWVVCGQWNKGAGWYNQFACAGNGDCKIRPTHWMPLPPPPEAA
jgi:hypothetical protein